MKMKMIFSCVLLLSAATAWAAPLRIKLGTLAPKDSSPHQSLKVMGEQWKTASGGAVTLTIYTDGTQGGEAEMVRRMRIGQLQAGLFTATGLGMIDESISALQILPMGYRSLAELDYVRQKMGPKLEARLAQKGFVALFWTDAGWVKFFSRRPALFPDDLRSQKLFAWAGDNKTLGIMKAAGYQPISLETADILPGLNTGLIDVVPTTPFYALVGQFYGPAPHMLDINWAPLFGGLVLTKKTWDAFPPATQTAFREAAAKAGDEIRAQLRKENDEAVEAMKKRGLIVHALTPEAEAAWRQMAESIYPKIRGPIVPADLFDEVQQLLQEYRVGQK
jgi:TRAP-type C4-dicarboxylate transport system substrate-binding protein